MFPLFQTFFPVAFRLKANGSSLFLEAILTLWSSSVVPISSSQTMVPKCSLLRYPLSLVVVILLLMLAFCIYSRHSVGSGDINIYGCFPLRTAGTLMSPSLPLTQPWTLYLPTLNEHSRLMAMGRAVLPTLVRNRGITLGHRSHDSVGDSKGRMRVIQKKQVLNISGCLAI